MHEIMFALGDLPKIIFKVHFVAGPTLKMKMCILIFITWPETVPKSVVFFLKGGKQAFEN